MHHSYCGFILLLFHHTESYILSDNDLKDPIPVEYLSHTDRYTAELRKACLLLKKLEGSPAGEVATLRYMKDL